MKKIGVLFIGFSLAVFLNGCPKDNDASVQPKIDTKLARIGYWVELNRYLYYNRYEIH